MENPNEATHGSKLAAVVNATECLVAGASSSKAIINNFVKNLTLSSIKKRKPSCHVRWAVFNEPQLSGPREFLEVVDFLFAVIGIWILKSQVVANHGTVPQGTAKKVSDLSCELGPM
ncbi:hypothetical protein OIU84_026022 [Salix udensis]|uniref:Uncharacterized protein n=1 Tax=Salix udensis TaxID=889485 RepID=A0AAD6KM86_9ROSI|nr:hypothetical protein OIU84_026022 [Salix udensis]